MKSQKTMQIAEVGLMSAVLCVLAPFTIPVPVSPVPLSLATFAVYLAATLLGAKKGMFSILIYLLLGLAGLPVFSGFSGGAGVLLGPTGGYLIGYIPCGLLTGWLVERDASWKRREKSSGKKKEKTCHRKRMVWNFFAMFLGTLSCYLFGTAWFLAVMEGYTVSQAVLLCVVPYLFLDMVKMMLAAYLAVPVKKLLRRIEAQ